MHSNENECTTRKKTEQRKRNDAKVMAIDKISNRIVYSIKPSINHRHAHLFGIPSINLNSTNQSNTVQQTDRRITFWMHNVDEL